MFSCNQLYCKNNFDIHMANTTKLLQIDVSSNTFDQFWNILWQLSNKFDAIWNRTD